MSTRKTMNSKQADYAMQRVDDLHREACSDLVEKYSKRRRPTNKEKLEQIAKCLDQRSRVIITLNPKATMNTTLADAFEVSDYMDQMPRIFNDECVHYHHGYCGVSKRVKKTMLKQGVVLTGSVKLCDAIQFDDVYESDNKAIEAAKLKLAEEVTKVRDIIMLGDIDGVAEAIEAFKKIAAGL